MCPGANDAGRPGRPRPTRSGPSPGRGRRSASSRSRRRVTAAAFAAAREVGADDHPEPRARRAARPRPPRCRRLAHPQRARARDPGRRSTRSTRQTTQALVGLRASAFDPGSQSRSGTRGAAVVGVGWRRWRASACAPVRAVDTTGAGDAFVGAFAFGLAAGLDDGTPFDWRLPARRTASPGPGRRAPSRRRKAPRRSCERVVALMRRRLSAAALLLEELPAAVVARHEERLFGVAPRPHLARLSRSDQGVARLRWHGPSRAGSGCCRSSRSAAHEALPKVHPRARPSRRTSGRRRGGRQVDHGGREVRAGQAHRLKGSRVLDRACARGVA